MNAGLTELLFTSCKQCHRLQHLSRVSTLSRTVPLLQKACLQSSSSQRRYNSTEHHSNYHDVVIAGGGLVGNAMACALGSSSAFQDKKILVLEAAPQKPSRSYNNNSTYDNRVFAITPGSKRIFQAIGSWDGIEARRYKPFQKMHVWDACGSGAISFDADTVGETDIAYIIEQSAIVESLTDRLMQLNDNVEVRFSTKIKDLNLPSQNHGSPSNDLASVTLDDGSVHNTKLIIGADGFNSFVRQKASLETVSHDYKQSGVVATLDIQQLDENITAWQRFLPTGPIALLPLSDSKSSLVWSTTTEHARSLVSLSEEEFVSAINNAFNDDNRQQSMVGWASDLINDMMTTINPGSLAGNQLRSAPTVTGADCATRAMFPLGMQHVPLYTKPRVVLIGDAAHRIHPMAGQGVNLGFGDVKALSRILNECVDLGEDLGSLDHLLKYETERQRKVLPVIAAISGLNLLFSTTNAPLVVARSAGLQATNSITPIKRQIISFAMG